MPTNRRDAYAPTYELFVLSWAVARLSMAASATPALAAAPS
ncbi:hypothetical protein [Saccharopolyspora spinosa]|nr:hypothetical protein [Saccharopolyspora spinosa]